MQNIIERARKYLAKIPPAIAGSGGHTATLKAAIAMVRGFNLTPEQALPLMLEWNAACSPEWTEADLRHKLTDAAKSATSAGYLLANDKAVPVDEGAEKAAKRREWPIFKKPTEEDRQTIATLRGVSPDAVYLMACHGHLWRCRWRDAECLAIRSGTFAQARRMDGQPFTQRDGSTVKALNLPGSEGAFLNPAGMGRADVPIIITEGAISILEAAEAIQRADINTGTMHPVAILAAVSASSRFTAAYLATLAGRRVRIIADNDTAGHEAAANWTATLRAVGCTADAIKLPPGLKDLGDALKAVPATDSLWQSILTF